jgi:hypothetical protein
MHTQVQTLELRTQSRSPDQTVMRTIKYLSAILLTIGVFSFNAAQAQESPEIVLERLRVKANVQPVGPTPFGESINLYTGELSFTQTDVEYPGTGPTITLTRSWDSRPRFRAGHTFLGDWSLDIPRIETNVRSGPNGAGWVVDEGPQGLARCSQFAPPYELDGSHYLWWFGYTLTTPGASRTLMRAASGSVNPSMSIGGTPVVFTGATEDGWRIGCLPTMSSGQPGEGFLAIDPQGTKYFLDYMISKDGGQVLEFDGGTTIRHRIALAAMLVTRIEDRFGNYLTFTYSGAHLSEINASDGRKVSIAWRPETDDRVASITVQPGGSRSRTTSYEYTTVNAVNFLIGVQRPDGSRWGINSLRRALTGISSAGGCWTGRNYDPASTGSPILATLTHPSGLVGRFTQQNTYHARSYLYGSCLITGIPDIPSFATMSLVSKEFSGPGVPSQTWTYTYAPVHSSTTEDACASSNTCQDTKWVDVVAPDSVRTRYTFSTRWSEMEGKQLYEDLYPAGSNTPIQSTALTYARTDEGTHAYPSQLGGSMFGTSSFLENANVPLRSRTITQAGTTFSWSVATGCSGFTYCFDGLARPTKVVKSSSP